MYIHHICYIPCTSQARRASASASLAASQDTVSFLILIIINLQSTAGLQEGENSAPSLSILTLPLSPRGFLSLSLCCRLQPRFCLVFKLSRLSSLSNPPSSLPSFFPLCRLCCCCASCAPSTPSRTPANRSLPFWAWSPWQSLCLPPRCTRFAWSATCL